MDIMFLRETLYKRFMDQIPTIIDNHFHDMISQGGDKEQFITMNQSLVRIHLTELVEGFIQGIFLDEPSFRQFQNEAFQLGMDDTNKMTMLGLNEMLGVDLSHNILQHIYRGLFMSFDKNTTQEHQCFLMERVLELTGTRLHGFIREYFLLKDKQLEYLHQQKLSVMGQMAAGMAHEIRNPLMSIQGFLQLIKKMIQKNDIDSTDFIRYIDISLGELGSIEELVNNFLILAKKDHANTKRSENINLGLIMHRLEELSKTYALQRNATIDFKYPEYDCWLRGNASSLVQIGINLIKNAIDAVPMGGLIQVKTMIDVDNEVIRLLFIDNGQGIATKDLDHLFEPFFSTKDSGTGLGLAICKELVEEMSGEIVVRSRLCEGTIVEVIFPFVP